MNAAMLLGAGNRRTWILLIAAMITTAILASACVSNDETQARIDNARRTISGALMSDLNSCVRIGHKMTYAGADIRNSLLPELKMRFFAVEKMNLALKDGFGEAYMPVSAQLIYRIGNAITQLEDAYRTGKDAKDAEEALSSQVLELNSVLRNRFDPNGEIIGMPTN